MTTSTPPPALQTTEIHLSPDVAEFCKDHGLLEYVDLTVRVASRILAPVVSITAELEPDPDSDEEYVVLNAIVRGSVEEVMDRYQQFIREWCVLVPSEAAYLIRVLYSFKDPE